MPGPGTPLPVSFIFVRSLDISLNATNPSPKESKLSSDLASWIKTAHGSGAEGSVDVPVDGCKAIIAPFAPDSLSSLLV